MRRPRLARLGIAAASLAGTAGIALFAGRILVADVPLMGPQVIVSLASHEWERLPEAARLAHGSPQALVLLTQPATPTAKNCHDCGNRVRQLVALGVPAHRIAVLPHRVQSTYDEALAVRAFVERTGARRVLVVTSLYHTRRALAAFRHALRRSPASVGVAGAAWHEARPGTWWRTSYGRWYVTREWAATVYYATRYGGFIRQMPVRPW